MRYASGASCFARRRHRGVVPPAGRVAALQALLLAIIFLAAGARGGAEPLATPVAFARAGTGAWLALTCTVDGVRLWRASQLFHPDSLNETVPLVGGNSAPLPAEGSATAAACLLDGADRLHLAWSDGKKLYYARGPLDKLAQKDAWRGAAGTQNPDVVTTGAQPVSLALAGGARPVLAGSRDGAICVCSYTGEWRETLTGEPGRNPAVARTADKTLHLVYAAPDGVRYRTSSDGTHWGPPEAALSGKVSAGPVLVATAQPFLAAVVDGKAWLATRGADGAWNRIPITPSPDAEEAPSLTTDRYGIVWCLWRSDGQLCAARWLGEALLPVAVPKVAAGPLLVEQPAPEFAPDVAALIVADKGWQVVRLPVPGFSLREDRPIRFLDLLETAQLHGLVREGVAPSATGTLPLPNEKELLPGGLVSTGKDGKNLRAWYSIKLEKQWAGCTAEWTPRGWRNQEALRLAAERPWLMPPSGAMAVIADPDEPNPARSLKMAAENAGQSPALLTSGDGKSWTYYAALPALRPLCLFRDSLANAEDRWKIYGAETAGAAWSLYISPDQEHWYRGQTGFPPSTDAVFWNEEEMTLGLLNGGRDLVAGHSGDRLVSVATLPAIAGDGKGRLFAPPFVWNGGLKLFLAAPDAWRWLAVTPGHWAGLRATGEQPGTCDTIPIALVGAAGRTLEVDRQSDGAAAANGVVQVSVLDENGVPLPGYTVRLSHGNGWTRVSWGRDRGLDKLKLASVRLRFTVEPGARLFGFRFTDR